MEKQLAAYETDQGLYCSNFLKSPFFRERLNYRVDGISYQVFVYQKLPFCRGFERRSFFYGEVRRCITSLNILNSACS